MLQVAPTSTLTEFPIPREVILAVESAMLEEIASGDALDCQDSIPMQHEFIPGAYARGMSVPAGTLIVGKIHRKPQFHFILSGKAVVFDEGGRKDICAPLFFVAPAGAKRVIYVVEDLLWFAVLGTNATTVKQAESELIAPSYADLDPSDLIEG